LILVSHFAHFHVHPCATHITTTLLTTSSGGQTCFNLQPSQQPFQAQHPSQTYKLSQMLAQASGLVSQWETNGALGTYSQAGNPKDETLAGQKLSDLNSLSYPSYHLAMAVLNSRFMGTTKELLRDGGKDKARTSRGTLSSAESTSPSEPRGVLLTQGMFPVRTTQLMSPPEEYTHLQHIFCSTYPSP